MVSAANIVAAVFSLSLWTVFAAASKDELVPGTLLPGLWVYSCRFLNSTALQTYERVLLAYPLFSMVGVEQSSWFADRSDRAGVLGLSEKVCPAR